jgi:hypothetical protein
MALGIVESGTQSATGEHALGSGSSTAGVYVCSWNLTDMVDGDVVRCSVRKKTLTGDTGEVIYSGWYANVNGGGDPMVSSPPVLNHGFLVQCYVEESGANTVSVPWSLDRVAEY